MVCTGKEAMQYGHNSEKREGDSPKLPEGKKIGKSNSFGVSQKCVCWKVLVDMQAEKSEMTL